jgi:hypothetical protein
MCLSYSHPKRNQERNLASISRKKDPECLSFIKFPLGSMNEEMISYCTKDCTPVDGGREEFS